MLLASLSQWDSTLHHWFSSTGTPVEDLVRLVLAAVLGGIVGIEREIRGREAGFRTYMLVCVGSALVMLISNQLALDRWLPQQQGVNINVDPGRIANGVMMGIGFLGAGVIIRKNGTVRGLTTGAGLWCVAAVGLAAGFGMYTICVAATLLILAALTVLDAFENLLPKVQYRTITLRTKWRPNCVPDAVARFTSAGLRVAEATFDRDEHDPQFVNVHLRISFIRHQTYETMERKIEADPDFDLMAAREL